jgi:hypothetical protein
MVTYMKMTDCLLGCCITWSKFSDVSKVLAASIKTTRVLRWRYSNSEMSVNFCQTTWHNNPQDSHLLAVLSSDTHVVCCKHHKNVNYRLPHFAGSFFPSFLPQSLSHKVANWLNSLGSMPDRAVCPTMSYVTILFNFVVNVPSCHVPRDFLAKILSPPPLPCAQHITAS